MACLAMSENPLYLPELMGNLFPGIEDTTNIGYND
jgi:hypothetical protein